MNESSLPLLYRAAKADAYGTRYEFGSGSLTDALFIYLDGVPEDASVSALLRDCRGRGIVCLTQEWAKVLEDKCPHALRLTRWMMEPAREFDIPDAAVPEGFTLEDFDKAAFDRHPFSHGENYAHYMDFRLHGVGAVVRHEGEIVASASSFLTYKDEVELDLFTAEAYRGRGLISACIAQVLRQCQARGLCVHWDAQNKTSRYIAAKFGFMELGAYTVYVLPDEGKEEDMGHTLVTRLDRNFTQFLHTMMEPYGANKIPFGRDCNREEADCALEYHMTLFHWAKSQDETYLPRLEGLKVPPARIKVTGIDWMAGEAGSTLVYLKTEPDAGFMELQREAERALQIRTSAFRHITLAADTDHEKMMRMLREIGEKVIFPMIVEIDGLDLYKIRRPTKKVRSL